MGNPQEFEGDLTLGVPSVRSKERPEDVAGDIGTSYESGAIVSIMGKGDSEHGTITRFRQRFQSLCFR